MTCPECGCPTRVPKTVQVEGGSAVVRIRRCTSKRCGWSFTTTERRAELSVAELRSAQDRG